MIATPLIQKFSAINDAQKAIIAHSDGPLLVIAGPGSGKTFSLVLRAMNLLLQGKASPRELVICTFTEKAAFELRDRMSSAAREVGYKKDLSELRVSTIHGFCNRLLELHRHRTVLGNNFEVLDELTQLLFIFDHFDHIVGEPIDDKFLGKWSTKWTAIQGVRGYFDKITEELVDSTSVAASADPFLQSIARAYRAYEEALFENNRLDFAHQQKLVYDLLQDADIFESVASRIKYVMVDEYQDTNYIQERILFLLTNSSHNLCVVGDEDQSLYRFRGATVRNILEFPSRVENCTTVKLTTNYRSHERIVRAYDRWMASANWRDRNGTSYRYDKTIEPDPKAEHPDYPSVFRIWGRDARDEGGRFAELVEFLKDKNVIEDYSQIALLLHSVRLDHCEHFLRALDRKGIPAFCPRARAYFDNEEVQLMVGCLALIFGYHGDGRGNVGGALIELGRYVDDCLIELGRQCSGNHPMAKLLRILTEEIQ